MSSTETQYEKVQAGDIQPGDRVARARTHTFLTVRSAEHGATSVRIRYEEHGGSDRPRKTAAWWREVLSNREDGLNPGARVIDREGDIGTVLREDDGRIIVDGDAGTTEWTYRPDELLPLR